MITLRDDITLSVLLSVQINCTAAHLGDFLFLLCCFIFFQVPLLVLTSLCLCWGLYGVEELWVVVKQDVKAVPILMVASAPIAAKLSPIVNALVVAKTAPGMDSQKSKMK